MHLTLKHEKINTAEWLIENQKSILDHSYFVLMINLIRVYSVVLIRKFILSGLFC
jgi:hypothetical protein